MKGNTTNEHDTNDGEVAAKMPLPIQRCRVTAARDSQDDGLHRVSVRPYGGSSAEEAVVLTPMIGSVTVPEQGDDVLVIYGEDDTPFVLGAWYALDRLVDGDLPLPDYDAGDLVLGTKNGAITVTKEGRVESTDTAAFDAHLSTTQPDAQAGLYANVIENVNVNDSFTKVDDSTVEIQKDGRYRVEYTLGFNRNGSQERNIMFGEVEINGVRETLRTRGVCYLRNSYSGDAGNAQNSAIFELNAGDEIRVYAGEENNSGSPEEGSDLVRGSINIEYAN